MVDDRLYISCILVDWSLCCSGIVVDVGFLFTSAATIYPSPMSSCPLRSH